MRRCRVGVWIEQGSRNRRTTPSREEIVHASCSTTAPLVALTVDMRRPLLWYTYMACGATYSIDSDKARCGHVLVGYGILLLVVCCDVPLP